FILQASATTAQLAQDTLATGIQAADVPTETRISLIDMIFKGGPVMIPIGILFVVSLYILFERLLVINKVMKRHENLLPSLKEMIHCGNLQNALAMCRNINSPESAMLAQGVSRI